MNEFEKALNQELYYAADLELFKMRIKCKEKCFEYNNTNPAEIKKLDKLIRNIFASVGNNCIVEQPFHCDYGINISSGDNLFINYNCVILDCNKVTFGNNVFIAPNCGFYTAGHPIDYKTRNTNIEYAKPINIQDNVWLGANVCVLPGVTIGNGCVIGAGSVVKNDIPPNSLAYGNPCVVIKKINQ